MTVRAAHCAVLVIVLHLLSACAMLPEPKPAVLNKYLLEYPEQPSAVEPAADLPTMIVTIPRAHGGYDTERIAYRQEAFGLRYYAMSRWADTPARMLAPLMAEAINDSGKFQALYAVPGSLSASYRLDSELIRIHQDFTRQPSEAHVTLRARLVSLVENRVLATQTFDISKPVATEDAYGGVEATNHAIGQLLGELAQFCAAHMRP
jgi:cholesterol transport system auxiliary component